MPLAFVGSTSHRVHDALKGTETVAVFYMVSGEAFQVSSITNPENAGPDIFAVLADRPGTVLISPYDIVAIEFFEPGEMPGEPDAAAGVEDTPELIAAREEWTAALTNLRATAEASTARALKEACARMGAAEEALEKAGG